MTFEILASGYGLVEGPTEDPQGRIVFSDVRGGGVHRVDAAGAVTTLVPRRREWMFYPIPFEAGAMR